MFTLLIIDQRVEGLVIVHKLKPRMDVTSMIKLMMIYLIYFMLFSFKQNKTKKNVLHFICSIRIKIVISSMTTAEKNECCKGSS